MWSTFCFTTAWKFCQPSRIADKEFDPRDTFWLFCPKVTVHPWYPSLYLRGSPKVTMTDNCHWVTTCLTRTAKNVMRLECPCALHTPGEVLIVHCHRHHRLCRPRVAK